MITANGCTKGKLLVFVMAGTLLLLVAGAWASDDQGQRNQDRRTTNLQLQSGYGQLPFSFEANHGQADEEVEYIARGSGYTLFLTPTETVLALKKSRPESTSSSIKFEHHARRTKELEAEEPPTVLRMTLVGANPHPTVSGIEQLPGRSNYLVGNNPAEWHTGVPHYAKVRYSNVYPGVDLVYYGNERSLEYDFVVSPNMDPDNIALEIQGADSIDVDSAGNLAIQADGGTVHLNRPVAYQEQGEIVRKIPCNYVVDDQKRVAFQLGAYDATRPLIIDPVLLYSTYLGGTSSDYGERVAVDGSGCVYVAGATTSTDFPTANPLQPSFGGGSYDAYVAKLTPDGSTLLYCTYVGGSYGETCYGLAVDSMGSAYLTGFASNNFPTTENAWILTPSNGYLLKLSPDGSTLVYSTYIPAGGYGLAVDSSGNAYTQSDGAGSGFPTTPGCFQPTGNDHVVLKLNSDGSAPVYATYLDGSGGEFCYESIAIDAAGNAYVGGSTSSTDFPTTQNAFQSEYGGGGYDAFVAKLNADGSALIYCTYLGGAGVDEIFSSIAVDASGNVVVSGYTESLDFPKTLNVPQPALAGGSDAFVAKLNADGSDLVYSTYLGGSGSDYGYGVAIDAYGNAYLGGETRSLDFPTTQNALQTAFAGGSDAMMAVVSPDGSELLYASYMGGSSWEYIFDTALDADGAVHVTGYTGSADFPTSLGVVQPDPAGGGDAFVAKFRVNERPIADAGDDHKVYAGTLVTLDGSGSYDPDENYPLTYSWQVVTRPAESVADLSEDDVSKPSITPDRPGYYSVSLVVTDSLGTQSEKDLVFINVPNRMPVANAGADQTTVGIGVEVLLDGTQSYDPDRTQVLGYMWTIIDQPLGSKTVLENIKSPRPKFIVDQVGNYAIELIVSDGTLKSAPDYVLVVALPDTDKDGVWDGEDNCLKVANASQSDIDGDGAGDVCDVCPADPYDQCNAAGSGASEIPADQGGTVETGDGNLTIAVDPGDLAEDTTLSVTQVVPTDPDADLDLLIGNTPGLGNAVAVYDMQPDGLVFDGPVTLTITADVSALNANQRDQLGLYVFDTAVNKFVPVPGAVFTVVEDPAGTFIATCTVDLEHFSVYAVIAPTDTDNDGVPDLFGDQVDYCPDQPPVEAFLTYTGDMLVATEDTGGGTATLRAMLTTEAGTALGSVWVDLTLTDGLGTVVYGNTQQTTPSGEVEGVASGLVPDVYTVSVASQSPGCSQAAAEALLVVFDPDVPRATGGGFILPDSESTLRAESFQDKANFGFIVRLDNDQQAAGNLEFQYKAADINLKSSTMSWYTVSNNQAMFAGEATVNGTGIYTFRVRARDGDLTGGQSDWFEITVWEGTDTEAEPYHRAKNDLAGGSIVIH